MAAIMVAFGLVYLRVIAQRELGLGARTGEADERGLEIVCADNRDRRLLWVADPGAEEQELASEVRSVQKLCSEHVCCAISLVQYFY